MRKVEAVLEGNKVYTILDSNEFGSIVIMDEYQSEVLGYGSISDYESLKEQGMDIWLDAYIEHQVEDYEQSLCVKDFIEDVFPIASSELKEYIIEHLFENETIYHRGTFYTLTGNDMLTFIMSNRYDEFLGDYTLDRVVYWRYGDYCNEVDIRRDIDYALESEMEEK